MIDAGVKGERLVRGEPTEVREVRALMQANVQVLELVVADVIKALMAGADVAMVTSAIYRDGPPVVKTLLEGLTVFMEKHRIH